MRVLLVDHDSEALETIARAIRGVLELDCVSSKGDALLLLRQNTYDVLIACERAVDGSGLDLLGRTTRTAVPLKRIFAAAPERLQLLGPRLAPFKVQRTINYPIDLEELWLAIAQVTGGPNDETDGTIERVVLDERGIPASGTTPRAPIPPRPPAPLGGVRSTPAPAPSPPPTPAIAASASGARAATARAVQPAPEPPLRAPPPPRQPPPAMRHAAATAQMRAQAPAMKPIPPMPLPVAAPLTKAPVDDWTPEPPLEDDFAQVAAQARMGVQRKVVDEVSRRKKQRLLTACGVAVAVAGVIVLLIEKFYDPEARARERAIAQEVTRMAEQQKVTDNLTLIEVDIENAIMNNEVDQARTLLATLVEKSPDHPRREFLQDAIDRAAELQKLAGRPPSQAQVMTPPTSAERKAASRPKPAERSAERTPSRTPDRVATRPPDRPVSPRSPSDTSPTASRTYGAPISEPPPQSSIPLDAPINSTTTAPMRRTDNFPGRTREASDSAGGSAPASVPSPGSSNESGSATVAMPPAAAPVQAPPAPVDVVPARIVKRVTPVVSADVPRKASGFVIVKFEIGANGRVSDVAVVESSPAGVFDEAATTAVRKWTYEPRRENGVAVSSQSKARLVFEAAN
ncbi:MAG TPA: TonB family protein [Steroidobacteraceae bacterium]|nr:TonB family protein [Steroidobacteraceae bacterium]